MDNIGILLVALVVGLVLGGGLVWLVLRASAAASRQHAETAAHERLRAADERLRAAEASARGDIAVARAAASDAQAEAAGHRATAAALEARAAAAEAERDAAVARAEEIAADRDALTKDFKLLSGQVLDEQGRKAEATAEQRLRATEQLMAPIRESLAQFNTRLAEVEKSRVAMATELRDQVNAVRLTGDELRRETASLSKALRKPQVRGAWGELQLKRVAELAGMVEHCDFTLQQTSTTSEDRTIRPDMKVLLGDDKFVFVDSKVPLTSFLDAHESADDAEQQRMLAAFARNVRSHVDQLSGKNYFKADSGTPEFVVLFLPSEALAAEALAQLPDLHEYAAGKGIVLATPTTLIAMLRAIAYSWRQAALADSAAEVFQLGRELYDRLSTMGGHFDRIGRALNSTVKAYNDTLGSMEARVLVSARRFRDLQVSDKQLASLKASEEHARAVTAPELLESATTVRPMIGRGMPEASELVRPEPELAEVVESVTPRPPLPMKRSGTGT